MNGADGLALFQQQRARLDLVILDLSMPFISGTELLQQIRTIDPSTKVIIFTGQAVDEDLVNQVQAVIPKPTHWNTLLKTVRSVLDR